MRQRSGFARIVATLIWGSLVVAGAGSAYAQDAKGIETGAEKAVERPFVEHRIALQLSDDDPVRQGLIVSISYKLLEVYGPDSVDVQVVAFGPGIDLLKADNPRRQQIDSLIAQGVTFNICGYTLETIERKTGKRPEMNPKAKLVPAGVPFLLSLAEKKYTIVRP
jgi:intracellular sulfur oxidation DsrE/DsrF family protein